MHDTRITLTLISVTSGTYVWVFVRTFVAVCMCFNSLSLYFCVGVFVTMIQVVENVRQSDRQIDRQIERPTRQENKVKVKEKELKDDNVCIVLRKFCVAVAAVSFSLMTLQPGMIRLVNVTNSFPWAFSIFNMTHTTFINTFIHPYSHPFNHSLHLEIQ